MELFFRGLILGFAIAAPVGPIGVLCIRRSLVKGQLTGFVTGLGAASADAFYGAVAAFGFTLVSKFLVEQQSILGFLGGLFLLYLGVKTFVAKPAAESDQKTATNRFTAYLSTFFLTLANPATILSFIAVFATIGFGTSSSSLGAGALVAGVFLGSASWWLILSSSVAFLGSKSRSKIFPWVNKVSGLTLMLFGIYGSLEFWINRLFTATYDLF